MDGVEDGHGGVVEAEVSVDIADVLGHVAGDFLDVHVGARGDLAADEDHSSGGVALAGDVAFLVVGEAGVEDGVGYLVAELVGMPFADRLRGEKIFFFAHARHSLYVMDGENDEFWGNFLV